MYDPIKERARLEAIQLKQKEEAQERAKEFALRAYLKREGLEFKRATLEPPYYESDYCGHDLYLENQGGSQAKENEYIGQHKEMFDGLT